MGQVLGAVQTYPCLSFPIRKIMSRKTLPSFPAEGGVTLVKCLEILPQKSQLLPSRLEAEGEKYYQLLSLEDTGLA